VEVFGLLKLQLDFQVGLARLPLIMYILSLRGWIASTREAAKMEVCVCAHIQYPLLVVQDLFEPAEVLLFERHKDHKGVGVVVHAGVVGGRLRVEETHSGLVPHIILITSDRGIIQPAQGHRER
jgi:hypothetical protein